MIQAPLRKRVALVTGGGRGIGRATAIALAAAGAELVILDQDAAAAAAVEAEISALHRRAVTATVDVTAKDQVEAAVARALDNYGRLDILVNNAGVWGYGRLAEVRESEWDRVFAVNLKGVLFCTQAVSGPMRRQGGGKIVNIASAAGLAPSSEWSAYCISKAAGVMLTQVAAEELADANIQVNVLCPGAVDTDLSRHITEQTGARFPHAMAPDRIAAAVLALVVPFEQTTTGQIVSEF